MRKHSFVLVILAVLLVLGLALIGCDNNTTNGATLLGTYYCQEPSTRAGDYLIFLPDGTCEWWSFVLGRTYMYSGDYEVLGKRLIVTFYSQTYWTIEWVLVDRNTIRQGEDIWKK